MPTYVSKVNGQRMICLNIISHVDGSGHTLFKAGLLECSSEDGRYFWIAYLLLAAYKYSKPVLL